MTQVHSTCRLCSGEIIKIFLCFAHWIIWIYKLSANMKPLRELTFRLNIIRNETYGFVCWRRCESFRKVSLDLRFHVCEPKAGFRKSVWPLQTLLSIHLRSQGSEYGRGIQGKNWLVRSDTVYSGRYLLIRCLLPHWVALRGRQSVENHYFPRCSLFRPDDGGNSLVNTYEATDSGLLNNHSENLKSQTILKNWRGK